MGKQVFILVLAALVVGWFVPSQFEVDAGEMPAAEKQEKRDYGGGGDWGVETPDAGTSGDLSEHVISRSGDGHFYANAVVNSRDYRVMVDTGASVVALTGDDARDMGLFWDDSEIRRIGRGASGDVMGKPVTLERMAIGDLVASDVQAVIIPEGLDVSLLGQSYLQQVGGMRVEADQMTLGN